jgi:hypothetical protein
LNDNQLVHSAGNRLTCPGRGMNPLRQWQKKKPRRPLRSPLPPLRWSPRRRPLRLRCRRPAWLKVSTLPRSKGLRRVVVVAMLTDTLVFLSTGAEAEGSEIPLAVPVENVALETQEAAVEAPERMEVATGEATATRRRGARRTARTCSGGGRPLTGDPGRGANPLGADDQSRYE